MRRYATLIAAAAILVTACGSGATTPPSAIPPSPSPPQETPTSSPSPSPDASAEVRFDGQTCKYLGPLVVTSGTRMTIDFTVQYEPSEVAAIIVAAVKEGTTLADIEAWSAEGKGPAEGYPPYFLGVISGMFATKVGPGSLVVDLNDFAHAHAWTVDCVTYDPSDIGRNGALIQVVSS